MTTQYRSSRPEVFSKKRVLKNFRKFPGKHLCQSLVFNKIAGLRPGTLFKKETVNFSETFQNNFFANNWCCTELAWIFGVFHFLRHVVMSLLFTGYHWLVKTFFLVYSNNWAKLDQNLSMHIFVKALHILHFYVINMAEGKIAHRSRY